MIILQLTPLKVAAVITGNVDKVLGCRVAVSKLLKSLCLQAADETRSTITEQTSISHSRHPHCKHES